RTFQGSNGTSTTIKADPTVITDFAAGPGMDVLDYSDLLRNGALSYDGSNPFTSGFLKLTQSGADAILSFDADGAAGLQQAPTVVAVLKGLNITSLVAGNFNPNFPIDGITRINTAPTGEVTVNGQAIQGETLVVTHTLADVDGMGPVTYRWQADGVQIAGVSGDSLTLTQAQVGRAISVVAHYADGLGKAEAVGSAATATIANINDAPTGIITINGKAEQGQTLTITSTLADADGLGALKYQWSADGQAIAGATASTFKLSQAEVGKAVSVKISYVDGFGAAESLSSGASALVLNVNDAPEVKHALADQLTAVGQLFSFAVPADAFADADPGDTLTYSAALADGSALPAWLSFNALTRTFSGTPGEGDMAPLQIRVTATDPSGAKGSDDFMISPPSFIFGTEAADVLTGTFLNDTIVGLGGNDTIDGGAGDDRIDGGDGDDRLIGNFGNDTLLGGAGNDTLSDEQGTNVLDGGAGNDSLTAQSLTGNQTLIGGLGNDSLTATGVRVDLNGGEGDDQLNVNSQFLQSGSYGTVQNGVAVLDGGTGTDYLNVTGYSDATLRGGEGNDSLGGSANQLVAMDGGDGNDNLRAEQSEVVDLSGGAGNDTLSVNDYSLKTKIADLAGGSGDDRLELFLNNMNYGATSTGRTANLDGGDGDDIINANITLTTSVGQTTTTLLGGAGNDRLTVTDNGAGYANPAMPGMTSSSGIAYASLDGGDGNDILSAGGVLQLSMTGGAG
ncbi:putative Ig domain-containing protein, partial [Roseateles albus]